MNRAKFPVEKMCKTLGISRSSFYDWQKKKDERKLTQSIDNAVIQIFDESKRTYGSPRISASLEQRGIIVSKSTVARVMQSLGLQARPRRKYVYTTDSKHDHRVFENILNRNFNASQVNKKWVSDITYIPTAEGWAYLTVIIDLADRMVVAWNLSSDMTAQNTSVACLRKAITTRKVKQNLIFHSDRGVQYCCSEFRLIVRATKHIKQSMSRKGNCWDNAPAESFFKTLKVEWTRKFQYLNIEQARTSIFDYIERWYNTKRRHSTLGYMSPLEKYYFLTRTAA